MSLRESRIISFLLSDPASTLAAALSVVGIVVHLLLYSAGVSAPGIYIPLWLALLFGGGPLVIRLAGKALRGEFGSDLLAALSIITAALLGEWLAGTLVVLMLSGGALLETYAVRSASTVLDALAKRLPSVAHKKFDDKLEDVPIGDLEVGDLFVVYPHENCPTDGEVVEGRGWMDESYLTGEPYRIDKATGSQVLSGAINGQSALVVEASAKPIDSRYAKIVAVMKAAEEHRPRLRRLADTLGAWYTPAALCLAGIAWWASSDPIRFLAVLVVATPCPLLIAIPVAIIGSISLAARRGIIIKDPAVLEKLESCTTAIFDKTGTLTYGRPSLVAITPLADFDESKLLQMVASVERYSKHPLAKAMLDAARSKRIPLLEAGSVTERPGQGLRGVVDGKEIHVTNRKGLLKEHPDAAGLLPDQQDGMECAVLIDGKPACLFAFRDEPREDGQTFISHLGPSHQFNRVMIVSGDREPEVRRLADRLAIKEVHAGQTPEQKWEIIKSETAKANTLFMGDGVNDGPALAAATVGVGFGHGSDVAAQAANAVVLESSLQKVDELFHIARRLRTIALQSAVGGMAASIVGMIAAAFGLLGPVAGAIVQEIIDVLAVGNALRAAQPPKVLSDIPPLSLAE